MFLFGLTPDDQKLAKDMLSHINTSRRESGLPALALNDRLCRVAKAHAVDMKLRRYFDHKTPEGTTPAQRVTRAEIHWSGVAENLASSYDSLVTVHRGLMESPGHRANILGDYQEVGIGAATDTDRTLTVVEVFRKR
jgi:uncharacterized protein YkwD